MRRIVIGSLAALSLSAPALASPLPDLRDRDTRWTASLNVYTFALVLPLVAGSLDYAVTEDLQIGTILSMDTQGLRATYRFTEGPWGLQWGLTGGGGQLGPRHVMYQGIGLGPWMTPAYTARYEPEHPFAGYEPGTNLWGHAGLVFALPLGGKDSPFTLRGDLGALYAPFRVQVFDLPAGDPNGYYRYDYRFGLALIPHLELGWRFVEHLELTIGGYGLAGLRGTF